MIKTIIVAGGAVLVAFHLWKGKIYSGFFRFERVTAPVYYWSVIAAEIIILAAIFRTI